MLGPHYIPTSMNALSRKRDPEGTREKLLASAFQEFYCHGFQAASLDSIVEAAGVTKGALYHHFPNKNALGYAVVDEVIRGWIREIWVQPLEQAGDPIDHLTAAIGCACALVTEERAELGCPLNNLAQEMSSVDEGFRTRINAVMQLWRDGIASALRRGQTEGTVRQDIDAASCAAFMVASAEGTAGLAKASQDRELYESNLSVLAQFLETLRAPAGVA